MQKKARNHAQKLTKKDKIILDKIFLNYALSIRRLNERYPSPKDYAKNVIKLFKSKNLTGLFYSTLLINNQILPKMFGPVDLDSKLESYIGRNFSKLIRENILDHINKNHEYFINSSVLTEDILKKLESDGLLENIRGKKNIKKYCRVKGIKKVEIPERSEGGSPSDYLVASVLEHIQGVLQKPEALGYLQKRILESGFYDKLEKYTISVSIWIAKLDPKVLSKYMDSGKLIIENEHLDAQEINDFESFCRAIQALDDDKIKILLDKISNHQSESNLINEEYLKWLPLYYFTETSKLIYDF